MLETYQDPDFIIPPPPEESDEYESDEETSDEEKVKLNDEEAAKMAEARIIDPGSFIDFSSLEPPPPPPEDDIQAKENTNFEPIYHGDNIRAMIMSSNTVQLGQLTIITELGCTIGSAKECQMRIREENVSPRHIVIQHRIEPSLEPNPPSFFQITFNSFALFNGQLKPATHSERVNHMDRLQLGSTIIILHMHDPGDTCNACQSSAIQSELPETLQMGMLTGEEQKEYLEKSEAERIREFYNFDRYCWGPGMCKDAQEKLAKREEKKQKLKDERIQQHLENSQTKVGLIEEKLPGTKRRGNKGFSVVEKDPVALAWYDDKTGQGGIGPDKPWQNKRIVRPNKKRQKLSTFERSELKYNKEEENRTWY